jgi:hypothetical protein
VDERHYISEGLHTSDRCLPAPVYVADATLAGRDPLRYRRGVACSVDVIAFSTASMGEIDALELPSHRPDILPYMQAISTILSAQALQAPATRSAHHSQHPIVPVSVTP